jgi:hypothetical protein
VGSAIKTLSDPDTWAQVVAELVVELTVEKLIISFAIGVIFASIARSMRKTLKKLWLKVSSLADSLYLYWLELGDKLVGFRKTLLQQTSDRHGKITQVEGHDTIEGAKPEFREDGGQDTENGPDGIPSMGEEKS